MASGSAVAGKYWHNLGSEWKLYFDNGKTYIRSNNMAADCTHNRAYMDKDHYTTFPDYYKSMYAYLLAGATTGKSLAIVLDNTETTCKFYGAETS